MHNFESNLSPTLGGFDVSVEIDPALQMNLVRTTAPYDFHPPMLLPPEAYSNPFAGLPVVWGPSRWSIVETSTANAESGGQYLGSDCNDRDLNKDGNKHH
jgi:hypothetical protein